MMESDIGPNGGLNMNKVFREAGDLNLKENADAVMRKLQQRVISVAQGNDISEVEDGTIVLFAQKPDEDADLDTYPLRVELPPEQMLMGIARVVGEEYVTTFLANFAAVHAQHAQAVAAVLVTLSARVAFRKEDGVIHTTRETGMMMLYQHAAGEGLEAYFAPMNVEAKTIGQFEALDMPTGKTLIGTSLLAPDSEFPALETVQAVAAVSDLIEAVTRKPEEEQKDADVIQFPQRGPRGEA